MATTEKAYQDIDKMVDDVVSGPDTETPPVENQPLPTEEKKTEVKQLKNLRRPVRIVAVDEPRRLPNGKIFDPLASDSESRITVASPATLVKSDLIILNGEWYRQEPAAGRRHRLEIFAELSGSTHRGSLFLNGQQFEI